MSDFKLYYPVKPVNTRTPLVNQPFGANPDYYEKFHDANGNPLKGHDGIDYFAPHGTPVYAAHDGMVHFERDPHGGEGMAIHATELFTNITGYPITMYWHLIGDTDPDKYPSPIPTDSNRYPVKAGDLIGYADNTGAPYESSGDHCHFGLFCVDESENTYNLANGFNGRIDPTPFLSGYYAADAQKVIGLYSALVGVLTKIRSVLSGSSA